MPRKCLLLNFTLELEHMKLFFWHFCQF